MTLIFATNNNNKVTEIRNLISSFFEIISLKEAGIFQEIPEPFETLEENASEKSRVIFNLTGKNCFSEDTGLEVDALKGAPGVYSARYAGENASYNDNCAKLLQEMEGFSDRSARFRTVISLIINGEETKFEGICEGMITTDATGNQGFGYDPVFIPKGATTTFAAMNLNEKQKYSHRAKAVEKLIVYLNRQYVNKK